MNGGIPAQLARLERRIEALEKIASLIENAITHTGETVTGMSNHVQRSELREAIARVRRQHDTGE